MPIALAFQLAKTGVQAHALCGRVRLAHSRLDLANLPGKLAAVRVAVPVRQRVSGDQRGAGYESEGDESEGDESDLNEPFHGIVVADSKVVGQSRKCP